MSPYNYDRLPAHMIAGARLYIEEGVEPGSFLRAVLENDFAHAWARADHINTVYMKAWAEWLWNDIPGDAWGSRNAVEAWLTKFREARDGPDVGTLP
jgi:hypothetical protein